MPEGDPFQPYQVNLLVDNSEQKGPPVIIESYPTYRNLFGSIERVVDRSGVWRTDFSRIKAGSIVKANGGYLVLNLLDALGARCLAGPQAGPQDREDGDPDL